MTTMTVGVAAANQVADVYLAQAKTATDGRQYPGVGELQPGVVHLRVVGLQCAAVLLDQRLLRGHLLLGDQAFSGQLLVPLQIAFGVLEAGLILLLLPLHLVQLALKRPRVDLGQQLTFTDALALGEEDPHQLAVDTTAHGHRINRRHGAQRLDLDFDLPSGRRHDANGHCLPTGEKSLPFLRSGAGGAPFPIRSAGDAQQDETGDPELPARRWVCD